MGLGLSVPQSPQANPLAYWSWLMTPRKKCHINSPSTELSPYPPCLRSESESLPRRCCGSTSKLDSGMNSGPCSASYLVFLVESLHFPDPLFSPL